MIRVGFVYRGDFVRHPHALKAPIYAELDVLMLVDCYGSKLHAELPDGPTVYFFDKSPTALEAIQAGQWRVWRGREANVWHYFNATTGGEGTMKLWGPFTGTTIPRLETLELE